MKKRIYLISCILISLFLIQFSTAVADWTQFGGSGTSSTQAQDSSYSSRFYESELYTDLSGTAKQSTANSNVPYQSLIIDSDDLSGNYLVLQNGNYLQLYDKSLNLLAEENTGTSQGQLSAVNYIGTLDNEENIVGFYAENSTILGFRVYNITGASSISLILESNLTMDYPITTNGVSCFTALGYGECYAFINEQNTTGSDWNQYFAKIGYNATSGNADITTYLLGENKSTEYQLLEPPAFLDADSDSTIEFLGFSTKNIFVVDYNGNIELNYTGFSYLVGAKFIRSDAGDYKVVMVENNPNINPPCPTATYNCIRYREVRLDGTVVWDTAFGSTNSGDIWRANGIAIEDYNGDGYDDVFTSAMRTGTNLQTSLRVYKGSDGSSLYTHAIPNPFSVGYNYPQTSLTIARTGTDSTFDFIGSRGNGMYVWDTANDNMTIQESTGYTSCVPADLDYDGLLDVICTSTAQTKVWMANYTNQNAYIDSVTYDPSLVVEKDSTLYTYISATDPESDTIYYAIKCNDSASFSTFIDSSTQSCTFDTVGVYNVSVAVRDEFHFVYDIFSQDITVTQTGTICDNDGTCEASQGETYANCPADCPYPEDTTQAEGGVAIPTKLVDTEDYNRGLLPSIYYGTLGFFSNTLEPIILLVFFFLGLAIIITIFAIVVKLVKKASNVA